MAVDIDTRRETLQTPIGELVFYLGMRDKRSSWSVSAVVYHPESGAVAISTGVDLYGDNFGRKVCADAAELIISKLARRKLDCCSKRNNTPLRSTHYEHSIA